jgi:hypothetical protein
LRLGVFATLRLIPSPAQSARGLAHSTTLHAFGSHRSTRQRLGVRWPSTAFHRAPNTHAISNALRPVRPPQIALGRVLADGHPGTRTLISA